VEEVFDLEADPEERTNIKDTLARELLQRLRSTLDSIIGTRKPPDTSAFMRATTPR
jgi:hypothetical protein